MRGLKYPGSPFGAVPYIGDQIFIKFRFMAYHEDTAFLGQQSPLQFCLGVHIQMIGRLVQQQDIGFLVDELAQPYLCLLTAA